MSNAGAAAMAAMQQAQIQMAQQQNSMNKDGIMFTEEMELRENNPAVRDAWEQYQVVLKLSRK